MKRYAIATRVRILSWSSRPVAPTPFRDPFSRGPGQGLRRHGRGTRPCRWPVRASPAQTRPASHSRSPLQKVNLPLKGPGTQSAQTRRARRASRRGAPGEASLPEGARRRPGPETRAEPAPSGQAALGGITAGGRRRRAPNRQSSRIALGFVRAQHNPLAFSLCSLAFLAFPLAFLTSLSSLSLSLSSPSLSPFLPFSLAFPRHIEHVARATSRARARTQAAAAPPEKPCRRIRYDATSTCRPNKARARKATRARTHTNTGAHVRARPRMCCAHMERLSMQAP